MTWAPSADMRKAALVFLAGFAIYLYAACPTLAPYRDAGEMATAGPLLGIAHPPSYPLYILLGRIADLFPLGSHAFRINLLSVLASSLLLSFLFSFLESRLGLLAALISVLALGANRTFLSVASVSEMYSLSLLFAALLLILGLKIKEEFSEKRVFLLSFLFGLFLGNRTDLLLLAPALAYFVLSSGRLTLRLFFTSLLFFFLGLSIYLALPLRSSQWPLLDWNHPADLGNFWGTLTRRGYGGTLDLLSKSYAAGANFDANLRCYGLHIFRNFGIAGILLIVLGLRSRGLGLAFLFSGPVFLFLANMPPNPHALAIVEPHWLLPDLILVFWLAHGFKRLSDYLRSRHFALAWALALACLLQALFLAKAHAGEASRRQNYFAYDFARNIFRTLPPGSILAAKEDVQIFSLWHYHLAEKKRPDLALLAQGISSSPWYRSGMRRHRPDFHVVPVKSREGWRELLRLNPREVFATYDAELDWPAELLEPRGLTIRLKRQGAGSAGLGAKAVWEFYVQRGLYNYESQKDFFNSDLIEAYSMGAYRTGEALWKSGNRQEAVSYFWRAWGFKSLFPDAVLFLGYFALSSGELEKAEAFYREAAFLYDRTLALGEKYRALPDVMEGIRRSMAGAYVNWGAILEKLDRKAEAEEKYLTALKRFPREAQAHYNLAVLYWGRDWKKVVQELQACLEINPDYPNAAQHLQKARRHLSR